MTVVTGILLSCVVDLVTKLTWQTFKKPNHKPLVATHCRSPSNLFFIVRCCSCWSTVHVLFSMPSHQCSKLCCLLPLLPSMLCRPDHPHIEAVFKKVAGPDGLVSKAEYTAIIRMMLQKLLGTAAAKPSTTSYAH